VCVREEHLHALAESLVDERSVISRSWGMCRVCLCAIASRIEVIFVLVGVGLSKS